ncbi:MAG: type IV pilus assembly protein PilF [Janthinobacterium sp.]|jgi:type IV pilus assembly protein PilF
MAVVRSLFLLPVMLLAVLLASCAVGNGGSGRSELATSSDQTVDQKRALIRMQLAIEYYEHGQMAVALDEIKKALQADPDLASAYGVRALIYMNMGESVLAEDNFLRALNLAPHNPDLSNNYGSFLCQDGRAAQSIAYFDAALKNRTYLYPANALNNAGSCSLKMRDLANAERYLLQALTMTPDLAATNANLAQLYYERRDYVRAGEFISRLSKTAKMESLSADVVWLAIKVQHRLGDGGAQAAWVTQLRRHHSATPEYAAYQRGTFND